MAAAHRQATLTTSGIFFSTCGLSVVGTGSTTKSLPPSGWASAGLPSAGLDVCCDIRITPAGQRHAARHTPEYAIHLTLTTDVGSDRPCSTISLPKSAEPARNRSRYRRIPNKSAAIGRCRAGNSRRVHGRRGHNRSSHPLMPRIARQTRHNVAGSAAGCRIDEHLAQRTNGDLKRARHIEPS